MTTFIVVDAHVGWPVEVTLEHGEPSQEKREEVLVIDPNQTVHFYIHSGCTIKGASASSIGRSNRWRSQGPRDPRWTKKSPQRQTRPNSFLPSCVGHVGRVSAKSA
jgi:hypothetical protein